MKTEKLSNRTVVKYLKSIGLILELDIDFGPLN